MGSRRRWLVAAVLLLLAMLAGGIYLLPQPKTVPRTISGRGPYAIKRAPHAGRLTRNFAVPVLLYHRVQDISPQESHSLMERELTVSPSEFDWQMSYLMENDFAVVLAREVEEAVRNRTSLPEKAVAITLDDGYRDNYDFAFPILRKYGIPATVFINASTIGTPGHLTWGDLRVMSGSVFELGSHSVHHINLTLLPRAVLDYELRESKRVIEAHINKPVTALAYPSGWYNEMVAERVKSAGYLAAWRKDGGPVKPEDDLYKLPRIRVRGTGDREEFKRKVWSGVKFISAR